MEKSSDKKLTRSSSCITVILRASIILTSTIDKDDKDDGGDDRDVTTS